jgi:hypothetical protein
MPPAEIPHPDRYGDMNFDTPLNDEQAHNMIIVLKKE